MANPIAPTEVETLVINDTGANALVVGGAVGATTGTGGIKCGPIVGSSSIADSVGTMATIRAGGIGIASQAALDLITAASATQLARTAKGTALQYPRMNSTAAAWEFATPQLALLLAASGTSTDASAANVSSIAISGLSALDTLHVLFSVSSATQDTAGVVLYNVTDSAALTGATTVAAGTSVGSFFDLRRSQGSNTSIFPQSTQANAGFAATVTPTTLTAGWTGSWTLALRHAGVVAGGTFAYNWAVYVLRGQ